MLAQAVSRAKGITFDDAVKAIELEVEQLKAEVTGGKTIAIDRVGRLYKGKNERVQFLADEAMERMLDVDNLAGIMTDFPERLLIKIDARREVVD